MWRKKEEQVKEEKVLHMTSHKGSQKKDVLNLTKRKISGIVESLVNCRKAIDLRKKNKEMEMKMIIRKLMLQVMLYKML